LNNRYALTVTMQVWPTADTPDPEKLIGPSVWLLDVYRKTAEKVVDPVTDRDPEVAKGEAGVFRPGSDLVVANGKLYVAEEDSLEGRLPADEEADGYVSIFDISDARYPHFIKRLVPHEDFDVGTDYLPADFAIAHGLGVTPDNRYVYVASYASGYILKIDTAIDQVVAVFSAEEGVEMPHGGFIPGNASDSSFANPPHKIEPRRFGFKK
jgi:YVTN family beta-propeller protein